MLVCAKLKEGRHDLQGLCCLDVCRCSELRKGEQRLLAADAMEDWFSCIPPSVDSYEARCYAIVCSGRSNSNLLTTNAEQRYAVYFASEQQPEHHNTVRY